jgi:hypothetical protein
VGSEFVAELVAEFGGLIGSIDSSMNSIGPVVAGDQMSQPAATAKEPAA